MEPDETGRHRDQTVQRVPAGHQGPDLGADEAEGAIHAAVATVQDVVEIAFGAVGLDWRKHVRQDPQLIRPLEPARLVGNPEKARRVLGWTSMINFKALITEMTLSHAEPAPSKGAKAATE